MQGWGTPLLRCITLVWMLGTSQGANPKVRAVKLTSWGVRRPLIEEFAGFFRGRQGAVPALWGLALVLGRENRHRLCVGEWAWLSHKTV